MFLDAHIARRFLRRYPQKRLADYDIFHKSFRENQHVMQSAHRKS